MPHFTDYTKLVITLHFHGNLHFIISETEHYCFRMKHDKNFETIERKIVVTFERDRSDFSRYLLVINQDSKCNLNFSLRSCIDMNY